MNKIKLHIDSRKYKDKEKLKEEVKFINNRITQNVAEVTPAELAKLVGEEGRTMVPSLMNGNRKKGNFQQTQLLALDFDNKDENGKKTEGMFYQSIEVTLEDDFIKENASFIYKTMSHTDTWEKFRVVFVLDNVLKTNEEVDNAYNYLKNMYVNADTGAMESARIFFGGNDETIEVNYNNLLKTSLFPELEVKEQPAKRVSKPQAKKERKTVQVKDFETKIPTWQLIKAGEKELVKERWQHYGKGKVFHEGVNASDFFRQLDMAELLGVGQNPFNDIIHFDANPSAGIWKPEGSFTYLYTTLNKQGKNGNNRSYDIIQVVAKLLDGSYMYAKQFLTETTGITIQPSEEIAEIQLQADEFKRVLLSDSFKEQHPEMYQIFGKYKYSVYINAIIDIFKSVLYEQDGKVECLSWGSVENTAKRLNISKKKAERLLTLIAVTRIADKLGDEEIPSGLLEKLEYHRTHVKNGKGEWIERKKPREYRSNVYQLGELLGNFTDIEERCVELVENGFTIRAMSREYLIRTFGVEEANRVYPQDKERKISKKSNEITTLIHKVAMQEIEKNGYVIVNELKDTVQRKYKSKNLTDYKYKQAEAEMLEAYGLQKKSLTNQLRERYHITHLKPTARPKVLVFE